MTAAGREPVWLGLGAQRSGTTWFTNLLTQHPEVAVPAAGKELHHLTISLRTGPTESFLATYRAHFAGTGVRCPGEFTPAYLRALWLPGIVRQVCGPRVHLLVLLRDPVDRFASAMRHNLRLPDAPPLEDEAALRTWVRDRGLDMQWAGMYATQLASWEAVFGADRLHVLQYEAIRPDPAPAVEAFWADLGLDPVGLVDVTEPSATSSPPGASDWGWETVPGLRAALTSLYRPEVDRLAAVDRIDPGLWPNFA